MEESRHVTPLSDTAASTAPPSSAPSGSAGADRRRGLRRDRRRDRAAPARHRRRHDPREGARPRRHLVLQQLPRRRLRRAQPPVLVLLRPAPRLVAAVLAAARRSTTTCTRSRATHGVDRLVQTDTDRRPRCAWDEERCRWSVADRRRRDATRPTSLILATGQLHQPAMPGASRAPRRSPATASTRPNGITTIRSPASASAVVGTGASAVQFVPEIAARWPSLTRLPAHRQLVPAAHATAATRAPSRRPIKRVPGLQAFRRRFMFEYCESLTLAIRHPRTLGRLAAARSAGVHALAAAGSRAARARRGPTTRSAASAMLFSSHFLPALHASERRARDRARSQRVDARRAS